MKETILLADVTLSYPYILEETLCHFDDMSVAKLAWKQLKIQWTKWRALYPDIHEVTIETFPNDLFMDHKAKAIRDCEEHGSNADLEPIVRPRDAQGVIRIFRNFKELHDDNKGRHKAFVHKHMKYADAINVFSYDIKNIT
jgi:hypothetical protein